MVWKGKSEWAGPGAGVGEMPEKCEEGSGSHGSVSAKCSEVANKLAHLFGWRHTYQVQRVQRANQIDDVIVVNHVSKMCIISPLTFSL